MAAMIADTHAHTYIFVSTYIHPTYIHENMYKHTYLHTYIYVHLLGVEILMNSIIPGLEPIL